MDKSHNKLRFVRRSFYKMKRKFGVPATLYQSVPGTPNRITGVTTSTITAFPVDKMIFLPETVQTKGAAQGTSRGLYEVGNREVIIDARDLPLDLIIGPEDYIVADSKSYRMVNIAKFETNAGWYLTIRWTQDGPLNQILTLHTRPFLQLKQVITAVKA